MQEGISIHLAPLALFHIGGIPVTNTLVTAITVSALLILFAFFAGRALRLKPNGFQTVLELLITYPYDLVRDTLQNDRLTERIFPLVMTLFLFVLGINWFGLLPFVASIGINEQVHGTTELIPFFYPGATDLNLTLALALVAFFAIEIAGIATLGIVKYAKKFITFASPLKFMVGIIELVSELVRLISFSFRLFGNIFAGKVLVLVIMMFVPLVLPVPFLAFETFVGFIQAAIFAMLTLFFTKIAVELHEESHESEEVRLVT
ncbi:MAG: F0F1 ATP synthase subunit A [Patescibacteria group bacterium]